MKDVNFIVGKKLFDKVADMFIGTLHMPEQLAMMLSANIQKIYFDELEVDREKLSTQGEIFLRSTLEDEGYEDYEIDEIIEELHNWGKM